MKRGRFVGYSEGMAKLRCPCGNVWEAWVERVSFENRNVYPARPNPQCHLHEEGPPPRPTLLTFAPQESPR